MTTISPLAKKLNLKPHTHAVIMGAPAHYKLHPLPEGTGISIKPGREPWTFLQIFLKSTAEVTRAVPRLLESAAPGAIFWIAYPKKSSGSDSDLSRDLLAELLQPTGWRPVSIVALDGTWSALRFRPVVDVKSRR